MQKIIPWVIGGIAATAALVGGLIFIALPPASDPVEVKVGDGTSVLAPLDSSKFVEDPATGRLVLCNRVIVDVIEGTPYDEVAAIAAGVGAVVVGRIPELDTYQFDFPGICDTVFISNVAKSLTRDPRVLLATPAFSVGEIYVP